MKSSRVGLVAAALVALMVMGCGKQEGETVATGSGDAPSGAGERASAPAVTTSAQGPAETGPLTTEPAHVEAGTLPPDVIASSSATTVMPSEIVEITAQVSADAVEVMLNDGIKKTPLAYDKTTNVWRSVYRVPMRTTTDRLGLSVTAKNGQGRWKRVWVFLELPRDSAAPEESTGS